MPKTCLAPTVLVIEDETDIRNFITRVLELEGYRVLQAGDGVTGLAIIGSSPVDLILLDILLPGIDGWDVLRRIKGHKEFLAIPVIIVSAIAEPLQRRRALRMGAERYLVKPMSAAQLMKSVKSLLQKRTPPFKQALLR